MRREQRLFGEDAAWLHMEDETNPMVVNGLLELGGALDAARLSAIISERLLALDRFRSRVVEARMGVPHWEIDPSFDLARHVVHVELDPGDASLRDFLDRTVSTLLERDRPLWRLYVVERRGAGTILLCRVHHAIADGFALMTVLLSLCDEHEGAVAATRGSSAGGMLPRLVSLTRLLALPSDPRALKRPLTCEKRAAWSNPIPLGRVKAIARAFSATINDVLVSAVAGALRTRVDEGELHAMVPVNLREKAAALELGNRFGLVILGLPIGIADPVERLKETKRRMDRLKSTPEAIVALDLLRAMGWAPMGIEKLGVAYFGKKASLVLTNVPGPRERLHLAGVPITRMIFWVPQSARLGLGISLFSYAQEITIGVLSDAGLIADPEVLVAAIDRELDRLEERAERAAVATLIRP